MTVRVEWRGDEFAKRAVLPAVQDGLLAAGVELQGAIKASINGTAGTSAPGSPPNSKTGMLRESVAVDSTGVLSVGVGTNKKYGKYLEFGALMRSKTGKWLTIPLNDEATKIRRRTRSLRSLDLVFIKSKKGNLLLGKYKGRGKNKTFEAMFLLRKQATLLARPWLRPGLAKNKGKAQKAFTRRTAQSLRQRAAAALGGGA